MYISSLELTNFRNYESLNLSFSEGTNILYGANAQGKTNVLESLYVAATTKSHRLNKDKEMIRFGEDESHIRVYVKKHDVTHKIDMHLRKSKTKVVSIDGLSIHRTSELYGLINIIFFSPEDLSIIKNGPNGRRRFIDMELCQLSRIYYSNLASYNKIMNQRNNLLKQISSNRSLMDTLDVWDEQLITYGCKVIEEREKFVQMINDIIAEIHGNLTQNKEHLKVIYDKSVDVENYREELLKKREMDLRYQSTQVGPHRDDLIFSVNDMDVRTYGSQGQQRTVALSLKLAEIQLVKDLIHDTPILLLDDVMSELDGVRRNALLNAISDIQTIITCTGYDDFIEERIHIDHIFNVAAGVVTEKK